jgi:long-subunit fatty acid transport protein
MGGAFTAIAYEYSAIYWNPACLAHIRQKDAHISLSYKNKRNNAQNSLGMKGDARISEIKLNSLGYVHPFPTLQGSFVMAMGYSRTKDFLDVLSLKKGSIYTESRADGHLSNFNLALAIDLSENISFGSGVALHLGKENAFDQTQATEYSFIDDYFGVSFSTGFHFSLPGRFVAGINTEFLNYASVDREVTEETDSIITNYAPYNTKYRLPARFAAGIAYATVPLTISADIGYVNWSNLKYTEEEGPIINFTKELNDTYRFGSGIEWIFPFLPVKFRLGAGYQTRPIKDEKINHSMYYTGGMGLLLDRSVSIDMAGSFNKIELKNVDPAVYNLQENVSVYRALLSIAYRF